MTYDIPVLSLVAVVGRGENGGVVALAHGNFELMIAALVILEALETNGEDPDTRGRAAAALAALRESGHSKGVKRPPPLDGDA